ncbi:hypothetical protein LCL89_09650 [Halobacillus yeomjeoni]|uniref:McrC family protein n=1 Tax=Halobacillus yeomjeoni TaxID=311194 RepID=UPI001CD647B0|nr:hypothetical protein [Halobacillus yeomjeoni]MCA0984309.1 hypothetical protein [Halobacillus yeomjeoni]
MEQTFKVPIRNLFCLLSYIHEMPELTKSMNEIDEDLITYDFIVKQFLKEVALLHRRGLVKDYIEVKESTNRLNGRLVLSESMPSIMMRKPSVVCEKDEYSANVLLNQIMKSTLGSITQNRFLKEETRKKSFLLMESIPEVDSPPLTKRLFKEITYSRQTFHYKRMIHIAKILHDFTLLSHKQGGWSLFNAELEDTDLNRIFEKFLFQFYKQEQKTYKVSSETLNWNLRGNQTYLPSMRTDVSLTHKKGNEKIVMDAKFYKHVFQNYHGNDSFHSHNMYQLFTYLMHQDQEVSVRGILVYPYNGKHVDEVFEWSERVSMEVNTLDLSASWHDIYTRLIGCLEGKSNTYSKHGSEGFS